jgi:tetratricopeptide (TPR) repeat protein
MFCNQCGKEIPDNSQFCNYCGTKVGNICPKCGTELPEESKFCHKCGTPLGANIPDSPPQKHNHKKPPKVKKGTGYYHNLAGNQLYNDGKYKNAIDEYSEALRIVEPSALFTAGAVYLINRGNAFMRIGDRQSADRDYTAAHQLYNYVFAYFHGDDWQNDSFCFSKDELKEIRSQSVELNKITRNRFFEA